MDCLKVEDVFVKLGELLGEYSQEETNAIAKGDFVGEAIWKSKMDTIRRVIKEFELLDEIDCEEEKKGKNVVPYHDNPHDMDYAFWH